MSVPKIRGLLVKQLDSRYILTAEPVEYIGRLLKKTEGRARGAPTSPKQTFQELQKVGELPSAPLGAKMRIGSK